jgi:hypothetical protein
VELSHADADPFPGLTIETVSRMLTHLRVKGRDRVADIPVDRAA